MDDLLAHYLSSHVHSMGVLVCRDMRSLNSHHFYRANAFPGLLRTVHTAFSEYCLRDRDVLVDKFDEEMVSEYYPSGSLGVWKSAHLPRCGELFSVF